ncbi:response regulator [Gelidibacter salicanalis]|uniref:Response regulator n=1 Tax=Gelidibacter salicanalis TaxID=291193 RepID=A0A934KTJ8_9FLAO|nr:response regulator [Gelidibacter salicanalis]MBJ7879205.1 response regulator [Gelidibacter salicanalis]
MKNQPPNIQFIIIDDDYLTTVIHHKKMARHKMLTATPIIFNDPRDALAYFSNCYIQKITNVILLDLQMPYLNGIQFLRELKRLKNFKTLDFLVFIVSSSIDPRIRKSLKDYPEVKGYYNKPISEEHCLDLKRKIQTFKISR